MTGAQYQSTASRALRRIRGWGRGAVFVPKDFLDLGQRGAVDVALHRLVGEGVIRRVGRGLYDYPKVHDRFGALAPSVQVIAAAVARSTGEVIARSGAAAANLLGLSTQVPARTLYLTSGLSRTIHVGKQSIRFKHAAPSKLIEGDSTAGLMVRAIRHMGSDHIDDVVIGQLRSTMDDKTMGVIRRIQGNVPAWMHPILYKLIDGEQSDAA